MTAFLATIVFLLTVATIVLMRTVLRAGRALDDELDRIEAEMDRVTTEGRER